MVRVMTIPLLLLLGLLGLLCPVWAVPAGCSPFQWFQVQHIQPNPLPCNQAMIAVNRPTRVCKRRNTFLHNVLQNVIDVCKQNTTRCLNGRNNCHQSASPMKMTDCRYTGQGHFPDCLYTESQLTKDFIVACDPPNWEDPQNPLVPVHLDKII